MWFCPTVDYQRYRSSGAYRVVGRMVKAVESWDKLARWGDRWVGQVTFVRIRFFLSSRPKINLTGWSNSKKIASIREILLSTRSIFCCAFNPFWPHNLKILSPGLSIANKWSSVLSTPTLRKLLCTVRLPKSTLRKTSTFYLFAIVFRFTCHKKPVDWLLSPAKIIIAPSTLPQAMASKFCCSVLILSTISLPIALISSFKFTLSNCLA